MMCPMGAHFMSKPLKRPTTFKEQAEILRSRNVLIDDTEFCTSFLSRVNYYRFTGYLLPYIHGSSGICTPPVEFIQLVQIYNFDTEIRNLIALAVEKIEIYIRTQLAYRTAHLYGSDGYMNAQNYNRFHDHKKFMDKVKTCISENSKSPVVQHHISVYGGAFPIWVIIDYFSLGMLSHYYADLDNKVKKKIATELYGVNYQILTSWLKCITDLRNRCAHYSRLYYWKFPSIPALPKGAIFSTDRRLFTQLYMLKLLYPEPDRWNIDFIVPLDRIIKQYEDSIDLAHIGFPDQWEHILSR